jgi:hypothetical protein
VSRIRFLSILLLYFCKYKTDKKGRTNRLLSFDMTRTAKETTRPTIACIRYRGNVCTEPLPRNDMGIDIQTHKLMGEIMKCAVEMGSGDMIYIPSFITIGSGIQYEGG